MLGRLFLVRRATR